MWPEIVERFLSLLLANWSSEKVSFWPKTQLSNVEVFWQKSAPGFRPPPVFFDVALYSINSIGEWWFNWQGPSIEGHTNEKPSIWICQRMYTQTNRRKRIALCRNFSYLMSPAIMAVIEVFLDQNYRLPSHFHDWDTRASNLTKTLGRLNSGSKDRNLKSATFCWSDLRS